MRKRDTVQYVTISCKQINICRVDGNTPHLTPVPGVKWGQMKMQCAFNVHKTTT